MAYNGELRELYNDLDKRIAADSAERITWRKGLAEKLESQRIESKEHRKYVHEFSHDMHGAMAHLSAKISKMPCRESIKDFGWLKINIRCLWLSVVALGSGIVGVAVYFANMHMGG